MRISDWSSDVCSSDLWLGILSESQIAVWSFTQNTEEMLAQRIINFLKYLPCGGTGFCKRLAHTHGLTALPWKNKSPHRPDTPLALHNVTLCDTKCIVMQDGFGQELDRQWPTCTRLACKMSLDRKSTLLNSSH